MKEKDSIIDCPQQQVILYVEKEDGKYHPCKPVPISLKISWMIMR